MYLKEFLLTVWFGEDKARAKMAEEDNGYEYFPVSVLVADPEASLKLHRFLLTSIDSTQSRPISAMGSDYEVGVVSINPAPQSPPAHSSTAVSGS